MEFSSAILSWNLRILQSLKRGLACASLLKKNISLNVLFCKINSLFVELKLSAQTKEEEYKFHSNMAWQIAFKAFWSSKCLILESITFALLSLADIPAMCSFQVKCLSIFTPKYFTEFVGNNIFH